MLRGLHRRVLPLHLPGKVAQGFRRNGPPWLIRFLADERCDSIKSMYMSSSETRIEPYKRHVFLFDSTRPILPHTHQRGGV